METPIGKPGVRKGVGTERERLDPKFFPGIASDKEVGLRGATHECDTYVYRPVLGEHTVGSDLYDVQPVLIAASARICTSTKPRSNWARANLKVPSLRGFQFLPMRLMHRRN